MQATSPIGNLLENPPTVFIPRSQYSKAILPAVQSAKRRKPSFEIIRTRRFTALFAGILH